MGDALKLPTEIKLKLLEEQTKFFLSQGYPLKRAKALAFAHVRAAEMKGGGVFFTTR